MNHFTNGADVQSGSILLTDFEKVISSKLVSVLPEDTCLINTTWFSNKETLSKLKQWECDNSRAFLYSGMDWENTTCTDVSKETHDYVNDRFETVNVGNVSDGHYFSFWLEFICQHAGYFFDGSYCMYPTIKDHFMCLNNKCNDHRAYLLNNIWYDQNLWSKGIISAVQRDERYEWDHSIVLEEERPYHMSKFFNEWEKISDTHISNDILSLGDPKYWNSHFVTVITESCHHSDVFLSEKVFKPLIGLRPFLVVGDKNLYSKLREFGFDTFEDLFPNVGKDEDNYEKRCDNLLVDLYNLCTMSLDDVDKLYKSILPRLEKNRNTVLTLMMANKKWIEDLKKL